MSPTQSAVTEWRGRNAVDSDGDKIGTIDEIYMDTETGKPEWLAVKTGLFGSKVTFIPIAKARDDGVGVRVPYDKQQVKDAPNADADGELSQEEEAASIATTASTTRIPARTRTAPGQGPRAGRP